MTLEFEQRPDEPFARLGESVRFDSTHAWCTECDALLEFTDDSTAGDLKAWAVHHRH